MDYIALTSLVLVIVNFACSYRGFKDSSLLEKNAFQVEGVLRYKEYRRLISSGFFHVSWMHLIFNMLALCGFANMLEFSIGIPKLLSIYFASLIGGNLFALFIHRNHSDYSAVGASGAVSGLVFACIALFPGIEIGLLFLPLKVPGWIYGLVYVLITIYGIKTSFGNIAHEAHLGGGLTGLLLALIMYPHALQTNLLAILCIVIPVAVLLIILLRKPAYMEMEEVFVKQEKYLTKEDKFNSKKRSNEKELDMLLDKIGKTGIHSLTQRERERLDKLSK